MGGRGASSGISLNRHHTRGYNDGETSEVYIANEIDLSSLRGSAERLVDSVYEVLYDVEREWGVVLENVTVAEFDGDGWQKVQARWTTDNVMHINKLYFNEQLTSFVYDLSVASGHHPSMGNKTGLQAIVAHEMGHAVAYDIARRLGLDYEAATDGWVQEALGQSRSVSNISSYSEKNTPEAVAEAFTDVYCNGSNAKEESRLIINVLKRHRGRA